MTKILQKKTEYFGHHQKIMESCKDSNGSVKTAFLGRSTKSSDPVDVIYLSILYLHRK